MKKRFTNEPQTVSQLLTLDGVGKAIAEANRRAPELEAIMIIGRTRDNRIVYSGNDLNYASSLMLLERFKAHLINFEIGSETPVSLSEDE